MRALAIAFVLALAASTSGCGAPSLPQPGTPEYDAYTTTFYVGVAALQVDDPDHAVAALQKATELAPDEPAGWADLGLLRVRKEKPEEGEKLIEKAAALAPDSSAIARLRALVADRRGQTDAAVTHAARAVELAPDDLKARLELVRFLERRGAEGAHRDIRVQLDAMQKIAPDNLIVMLERARNLAKLNDAAALAQVIAALDARKAGWPEEAREEVTALQEAAKAGKPVDTLFLQQTLSSDPQYQEDLAAAQLAPGVVGEPLTRTLKMVPPEAEPAPVDAGLKFAGGAPGPVCGAAAAVWPKDVGGKPAVISADAAKVAGQAFPGGGALPSPHGIAVADLNHDWRSDLVLAGGGGLSVLLAGDKGGYQAGASFPGAWFGCWAADLDLDGDMDVVAGPRAGASAVYLNDGLGKLTAAAGHAFAGVASARDFVFADLDGEGTPDAAFVDGEGKLRIFRDQRAGRFKAMEHPVTGAVAAIAAGDVDRDGRLDLVVLARDGAISRLTLLARGWDLKKLGQGPKDGTRVVLADLDLNGALDIVASAAEDATVLLGDRAGFQPGPSPGLAASVAADLDGDGHVDLIGRGKGGALATVRTAGAAGYHWQALWPRAAETKEGDKRINTFGVGGVIEVRSGRTTQKQIIAGPVVHFGLGTGKHLDGAWLVWPNGTIQGEFDKNVDAAVETVQRIKSSCPFLFTDNGREMTFVTDFLWRSPLGLRINAVDTAGVAQTEDRVKIRGDQLVARDGRYDVRITAELWETHFFDHVALEVVDHPAGTEAFVDERFAPAAKPSLETRLVERLAPVASARDDRGRDVTADLTARDGRYLDGIGRGEYQGVTRDHWVELPDPAGADWLVAQGWIHPTDSSINVAIGQSGRVVPHGLSLEAQGPDGSWRVVQPDLGFPAGKHKTILVPVTGVTGRVRLRTNLEVYWDALSYAHASKAAVRSNRAKLASAELRHRGFSASSQDGPSAPELPEYGKLSGRQPRWRDLEGFHTRFGDVLPLLAGVDDRYAILNAGDEIRLSFVAAPAPAAGWMRDYVMVGDGWEKDGDYNTAFSRTVLPLPSHDDPAYAREPGTLQQDPVYRRHAADWRTYHTRYVTPRPFARALWAESR